jgi:hypothetical protein
MLNIVMLNVVMLSVVVLSVVILIVIIVSVIELNVVTPFSKWTNSRSAFRSRCFNQIPFSLTTFSQLYLSVYLYMQ